MSDGKRQTKIMIGVSLLIIAGIMVYVALSQPRVYSEEENNPTAAATTAAGSSSAKIDTTAVLTENTNVNYPLNINTASYYELQSVNGIGEKRAAQIIAYREEKGGFNSVEELKQIKGFGGTIYDKVAPYLTV